MNLGIIYARSRNYCIGKDGNVPWNLPDEFSFFESVTDGHPVIMGRKTFEEDPEPLACRLNIVVSSSRRSYPAGVSHAESLHQAIVIAGQHDATAFVIGGAGLIKEALPRASVVYESVIDAHIEGDAFIDALDFSGWRCRQLAHHAADERHPFGFQIRRYDRNASQDR